jgi:hypothetical protein
MPLTVRDILVRALKKLHADGLASLNCGCGIDNLAPHCPDCMDCVPAVKQACRPKRGAPCKNCCLRDPESVCYWPITTQSVKGRKR